MQTIYFSKVGGVWKEDRRMPEPIDLFGVDGILCMFEERRKTGRGIQKTPKRQIKEVHSNGRIKIPTSR